MRLTGRFTSEWKDAISCVSQTSFYASDVVRSQTTKSEKERERTSEKEKLLVKRELNLTARMFHDFENQRAYLGQIFRV